MPTNDQTIAQDVGVLQNFPEKARVVILHPNYSDHNEFTTALLNDSVSSNRRYMFISFNQSFSQLSDLWQVIGEAIANQLDNTVKLPDRPGSPDEAANALASALKKLAAMRVILCGYDLIDPRTAQPFLSALIQKLPEHVQLVLSVRSFPVQLLKDEQIRAQAQIFPIEPNLMLNDYLQPPKGSDLLEVFGLGAGEVYVNSRKIEKFDGLLPLSLCFFICDRGMVTRDEVFGTFWPALTTREATNVFHVTKRKITEILGVELTSYWSGFYRINPDIDLQYDVVKFLDSIQRSMVADDDDAVRMLEHAIALYRGTFLSGPAEVEWAYDRREELRAQYVEALASLGRLKQNREQFDQALGLYQQALSIQPHREDLARGVMDTSAALGMPARALMAHKQLVDQLQNELNVTPDPQTTELMQSIMARYPDAIYPEVLPTYTSSESGLRSVARLPVLRKRASAGRLNGEETVGDEELMEVVAPRSPGRPRRGGRSPQRKNNSTDA